MLQLAIKKPLSAFSLIELMMVVAIIGILAAIAIPAYSNYSVRARIADMISVANPVKQAVGEYRVTTGSFTFAEAPDNAANLKLIGASADFNTDPSGSVSSIKVDTDGVIHICGNATGLGISGTLSLFMVPTATNASIKWACQYKVSDASLANYLPGNCRATAFAGTDKC